MNIQTVTPFQMAIDTVEALPFEDREQLLETLSMRMAENRREQIAANAREALTAVREKRAMIGNVDDLKHYLLKNNV